MCGMKALSSLPHDAWRFKVQKLNGKSYSSTTTTASKTFIIREHLKLSQAAIKDLLNLSAAARISEYENGKREPSVMVTLGYSHLAQVPMESLVDDGISLNALRKLLSNSTTKSLKKIGKQAVGLRHARRKERGLGTR